MRPLELPQATCRHTWLHFSCCDTHQIECLPCPWRARACCWGSDDWDSDSLWGHELETSWKTTINFTMALEYLSVLFWREWSRLWWPSLHVTWCSTPCGSVWSRWTPPWSSSPEHSLCACPDAQTAKPAQANDAANVEHMHFYGVWYKVQPPLQ